MWLLYTDETNLEERAGDFFVYAGLAFEGATAKQLSEEIDQIRAARRVPRDFLLKFNPGPKSLSHPEFIALKSAIIDAAVRYNVGLLVYVVLHDIAKDPDKARRNGINTICYHYDCLLTRVKSHGIVLIDRFNDRQIDAHLVEKFSVGITGLPYSREMRLSNVLGFHYSAVGQSHFSTLIDIVLGSLRFSINAYTRRDQASLKTAQTLLQLISPLFVREGSHKLVSEISFFFSPKSVQLDHYRQAYAGLKTFLTDNGIDTAQRL